jgi:hypothetical protein
MFPIVEHNLSGTVLSILLSMDTLLDIFCVERDEAKDHFKLGPAIALVLLILTFVGTSIYIFL